MASIWLALGIPKDDLGRDIMDLMDLTVWVVCGNQPIPGKHENRRFPGKPHI